jgi:hypothetical protein
VAKEVYSMMSPSEDSTLSSNTAQPKLTEQALIQQIQEELLALIRVSSDEAIENLQKMPVSFGQWGSTLESEICHFLW